MASMRTNLDRMSARMTKMAEMGGEGLEIATRFEKFKNDLSDTAADTLDGMLGLLETIRDDFNPLLGNIIAITDLPALVAQTIIRVVGALRPTKQQATTTHEAFCAWRKITKPATRDLIDALEISFDTSVTRWIETLESEK